MSNFDPAHILTPSKIDLGILVGQKIVPDGVYEVHPCLRRCTCAMTPDCKTIELSLNPNYTPWGLWVAKTRFSETLSVSMR